MGFFDSDAGLGLVALGPLGYLGGSYLDSKGGLSNALGIQNNYKASNPYSPDVLQYDINNQQQIGQGQQSLAQALQQQMAGQGPNPAQTQFLANQQNNIANAQGMIASQRGLNPALAARMGSNIAANQNQQAALGSALLQQQQQLGATASLGNLYGQMQQGNIGYQNLYNNALLGSEQINSGVAAGNTQNNTALIGGLIGGGSAIGAKAATGGAAGGSGGAGALAAAAAHGGRIPGKANVPGDSNKNDTVPTMLSPGEIVIPRSVAHDPEKAKEFVDHLLKTKDKKSGYGDVVAARRKKSS